MKNVDKILKKYLTKDDYKKYYNGGENDEDETNKLNGGQIAQGGVAVAGLATPLVAQQNEVAGGVLGGATTGAGVGAMFGPVGMGVGAGVGAVVGGIQANNAKNERENREREYQDALNKKNYNLAVLRGKQTPVNGNQTYSLTERKEGGKLSSLSSNTVLATGATHEEGGIKLPQLGAEVEDKETLKKMKDGGTYVMSDTLINPKSGNTFAKDDMNLSKLKGKLEKSTTRFKENGLSLLKNKEQKLVDTHEQVRQEEGLETADDTQVARNGGMLKYRGNQFNPSKIPPNGGEIDSLANKYYTQLSDWDKDSDGVYHKGYDYWAYDAPELSSLPKADKIAVIRKMQELKQQNNLSKVKNPINSNNTTTTTPIVPNTNNIKTEQQDLNTRFGYNTVKEDGVFGAETNRARQDAAFFDAEKPQLLEEPITKFYGSRQPISVSSTEEVSTQPTTNKFGKINPNLSKLTPYIDNITGAIYNYQRSKEKIPNLQSLTYLNPNHVNYSQALKDTRDTTTAFNRGVDTTNVNQGNANIMKAFALGEQQKGIARISQEETNVNTGIDNDFAGRNKTIEQYNNEATLNNSLRQIGARDDIRREGQQNIVSTVGKLGQQRRDAKTEALYKKQNQIDLLNAKPETLEWMSNPVNKKKALDYLNSTDNSTIGKFGGKFKSKSKSLSY